MSSTSSAIRHHALPTAVQSFLHATNRVPDEQVDVTATDGSIAYRIVRTAEGHRLEHPSLSPARPGDVLVDDVSLEDACRLLIVRIGDRLPWQPGTPRYGIPSSLASAARLDRVRPVSLDRLAAAYLGDPVGVLDRLDEPAALHLLGDELLAITEAHADWTLLPTDGPHGVRLTSWGDVDVVLRRELGAFVVLWRAERSNTLRELQRFADLESARSKVREILQ